MMLSFRLPPIVVKSVVLCNLCLFSLKMAPMRSFRAMT